MKHINILLYGICLTSLSFAMISCNHQKGNNAGDTLFTLMSSATTNASFINHLDYDEQLRNKFNIYTFRNFYNGGGVALGDINNDGLTDIFMVSNTDKEVLYLNKGNFEFLDISEKAGIGGEGGWSTGVSFADVNGDGWIDIYVCNAGNLGGINNHNKLYINNKDLTFTEQAERYGIGGTGNSTQGVFFDYDNDGDLDLYLLNNFSKAIGSFNFKENLRNVRDSLGGDVLFRNDGDVFTDVSEKAGIFGSVIGFGLGVTVGDIDLDGWMDIYVSNDFFERDYIYLNNHDGTFREQLTNMTRSISAASMGADMADINNDCFPEIFATDMVPEPNDRLKTKTTFDNWESYKSNAEKGYYYQFTRNMLQLNNGDGTFSEIGRLAGVNATDWSWGALIYDMNNDGLKDLFVANGIYKDLTDQDYIQYFSNRDMVMSIISGGNVDYKKLIDAIPSVKIPSYAFENEGNCQFVNKAEPWGLATPSFSNGSAYGDLDNDGDLDLVVNNVNMPMFIYRNEANKKLTNNHFLKIVLHGEKANTHAIGAKIIAKAKNLNVYLEQMPMRGYLSSVDHRPNLGLGSVDAIDTLIVIWPSDKTTLLYHVKANQILDLFEKDAKDTSVQWKMSTKTEYQILNESKSDKIINFVHREEDFNDFDRDRLLYHMVSTEGPRICKGDMNGDGREDVFIGGAKNQAGSLFIQQSNGSFLPVEEKLFEADRISEDTDCAMFDADNDGDTDLYVASGGNELPESSSALNDRLYLNDGKGHLTKKKQILPAGKYESTGCVKPCDFDNDGVIELFVGIRLKPFLYGIPVNGYILENDGKGKFINVTQKIAPGLLNTGMIRDMAWADIDGDKDYDMIVAGDWMPVKVFINENNKFTEKPDAFSENTRGWWNCLEAADIDNDGDIDFVAGNHGLNSRFRADEKQPVSMYVNDFDLNGSAEQIICTYNGGVSYPLALKHDLTRQIPTLMTKYKTYDSYKNQTIRDIFTPEKIAGSLNLEVVLLETSLFVNDGKGVFTRISIPVQAQYSPVYAIEINDFDNDGFKDIILGGNLYNVKPEVGRYDASYGIYLKNTGGNKFQSLPSWHSGLQLEGEIRDIQFVRSQHDSLLFVARNNASLQIFKISHHVKKN